jgi:hypothetical protein
MMRLSCSVITQYKFDVMLSSKILRLDRHGSFRLYHFEVGSHDVAAARRVLVEKMETVIYAVFDLPVPPTRDRNCRTQPLARMLRVSPENLEHFRLIAATSRTPSSRV